MRTKIMTLAAVLALGACNPGGSSSESADSAATASGVFPNLTAAAYRLEANVHSENGETTPIVMVRDGQKSRIEFSTTQGSSALISDGATGESLMLMTARGQTIAMRANTSGVPDFQDPTISWQGDMARTATQTGPCTAAGQDGAEWSRTENGVVKTACVTSDGIFLGATDGGRTVWETTSVTRGAQPADQFTLPPGVQVMDMGNVGGLMDAIQKAQGD